MEYCQNCQKELSVQKFAVHLGYCLRNITKCNKCHQPYDKNLLEEHNQEYHQQKLCEYCQILLPSSQYSQHLAACPSKPINCQYCQLNIPPKIYPQHQRQCEARSKICPICKRHIAIKNYQEHTIACEYNQANGQDHRNQSQSNHQNQSQSNCTSQAIAQNSVRSLSNHFSATSVTRIRYQNPNSDQHRVIRHQIRYLNSPNTNSNTDNTYNTNNTYNTSNTNIYSQSQSSSYNTLTTNYTNYVDTSTKPNSQSSNNYTSYRNSETLSQYGNMYYNRETNLYNENTNSYHAHPNYYARQSLSSDANDDPALQAALMASLGYSGDSYSAQLYQQIQRQSQIQKQLRKNN